MTTPVALGTAVGGLTVDVEISGALRVPTVLPLKSWDADVSQQLLVEIDVLGGLSIDVTPVAPPEGLEPVIPSIINWDFEGDLVLDDNGRPT